MIIAGTEEGRKDNFDGFFSPLLLWTLNLIICVEAGGLVLIRVS